MLSTAARARLTVVLVGARNPSNIGAAARAMQDFGFSDLRIVNDFAAPFEAAQLEAQQLEAQQLEVKSAVAAHSVMRNARRFDNLAAAIADCTLIVATTAIGEREIKQPLLPLQQISPLILSALNTPNPTGVPFMTAPSSWVGSDEPHPNEDPGAPFMTVPSSWVGPNEPRPDEDPGAPFMTAPSSWVGSDEPHPTTARVALLFGSEKTGLTNDQLSHATLLITIPMFSPTDARHLSMNLGQSVAVCLYELTRSGFEHSLELPQLNEPPSTAQDRELLTQLLLDVLEITDYTRRFPANASEHLVRQLIQPLGTSHRQAMTWMGILRQILWSQRSTPQS